MERGKVGGRGSKNKHNALPSDFIIPLGSKSSRSETSDSKKSGHNLVIRPLAGSSSSSNERKKEGPPIQSLIPPKKPKLSPHSTPSRSVSYAEAWEVYAEDCEPVDLVPKVLEAIDNDESDKVISLLCGAVKALRIQKWKPDPVIIMGLLYLVKIRPSSFLHSCVVHAIVSLLKREQNITFKSKGNPLLSVFAANLLMRAHHDKKEWPDIFIKHYIDDALGDRSWIDNEECKCFIDNIMTAFNTKIPPKSILQPELSVMTPRDSNSPSIDDEDSSSKVISLIGDQEKCDLPVVPRYSSSLETIEQIVLEVVKEHLNRRQPDAITRNFLKLLSSTSGFSEIRNISVSRLEIWLHNPKLMRPAQELLMYICYNCTTHTKRDVEVISQLVKMRLKTKAVINLYSNGVKELICLHPDNLATILKHTIYNELSSTRNGYNMTILSVMFLTLPDQASKLLAETFQDLLMNKDDYLRSLRTLFREIVRVCRHDINYLTFARTLMGERPNILQQLPNFEFKERMFTSIVDLLCLCPFLAISPQIREVALSILRGDKKDILLLIQFQNLVSALQYETVSWLQSSAPVQMYGVGKTELLHALHKIMIMDTAEQYYKLDNFPPEGDRQLYMRLVTNVPLLENTLFKLIMVGFSNDNSITYSEMLDFTDQLIQRVASNSSDVFPLLEVKNLEIFELIFNLCAYQPPGSINIPAGYVPPNLAISNLYWKGWIMLLILAAHNPITIGATGWKRYPILRTIMEMCITNHFSYPPPTMAVPEIFGEERAKELQTEAIEKQEILQYETYLAAASQMQISEQSSLLLSQLITMDPTGITRRPPPNILDQIQALNTTLRLGHLLCRSRKPDFLLDIIQRQQQSSSQSMPWLAGLVQNSEGSFDQLPVQCLCEYLLSSAVQSSDKQSKQQQLLAHLQMLLTDPNQDKQYAFEVLEYFLRRLGSQQSHSRIQAITGLKLVLNTIPLNKENIKVDESQENEMWLLRKLPTIPHFSSVKALVATALRQAVQVENNPDLVREYIMYLSMFTPEDDLSELTNLVNEISQLVVERNSIMAAILPHEDNSNLQAKQSLHAFMSIYCNYLSKARAPSDDSRVFQWSDNQDLVLVVWATGQKCTMHILVVHAMIILLTYNKKGNEKLFNDLLNTWFPEPPEKPPQAFLVDTSEEALLIPDWLKLRIIRSNISRLVDAALKDLEPYQLVLFIQSFGVPIEAMTKLLHLLDAAVEIDPDSVTNAVLDRTYMAQLVKILHIRGASGGLVFTQKLNLQVQKIPDEPPLYENPVLKGLPSREIMQKQTVIQTSQKADVPFLINRLFIESLSSNQKEECYRRLQRTLAKDLQKSAGDLLSSSIVIAVQHINSILSSIQAQQFISSLLHLTNYSCTIMRVILLPLKKPGLQKEIIDMASNMCLNLISLFGDSQAAVLLILRDFLSFHKPKTSKNKENSYPVVSNDPKSVLEAADTHIIENVGQKLLDQSLKHQKTDSLIEAMARLLVTDSEQGNVNSRTGLLIDWLASLEPELIGTCPNLQMKLLFGKTKLEIKINEIRPQDVTYFTYAHSCRPYLLTLLTHGSNWATLHKCVTHLLKDFQESYDLTSVLDFLWALTRNPKFWQGHCEYTTSNPPEDILLLDNEQLLVLVKYLIEEAVIICQQQNRKTAIQRLEARLELFLCCSTQERSTRIIVKHLADQMTDSNNYIFSDMAHQFLLHVYMKLPKIICYLTPIQVKKLIGGVEISEWSFSALDGMTHSLFIALATPKQKSWTSKSRELELCARKMAAAHPILVLRQLPLLASCLTGCCDVNFHHFKTNHYLSLYNQVMGILELLQPHVFNNEHRKSFEATLDNYFLCFQRYFNIDELSQLIHRFSLLLQGYVVNNEQNALRYLQKHIFILHDLRAHYLSLDSLKNLVSAIPLPKDGEPNDGGLLIPVTSCHRSPSPVMAHWPLLIQTLTKIQGDDVFNALQEVDHYSVRKPSALEPIVDVIADLLISPQGNIRSLAHTLIARALKQRPNPNLGILSAFQRCLESPRADILMSALDRLPDIVLCMQEYALPLMQKVFELGVNSHVNTIPYINKTIALLNAQKGC